ncbi:TRAP transporter substrate-binding protein DctP [Paracoccus aerodenitrificans]|uniref:TRAP transporter substrate-binding protein DctP n=1 Tax=Paracoccus aerodenitrificans TaxID=3017781 RepID=UPI0022F11317|nr:TRAP transporter substrate-binding protein DctP [Paracoccus aerodenitrificans]WBU62748.1 TRAP transporter substrate-binding protein DctP [Paracoccus aerodenitrificans]
MTNLTKFVFVGALAASAPTVSKADANLIIAASLPEVHFWVGKHMNLFADAIEERTDGDISFTRFYAGEITSVGRELDGLQGGSIDVAAPLLAPYHEGTFPLSDVTQLPTLGTTSLIETNAFLKLMDSDVELADGKTFYEYEIEPKGIHAWPVGTTSAYAINFAGVEPESAEDLNGMPLRAGSALHTIFLEELGSTPVTMPSSASYEALSRGTVEGTILSVADWRSYSLQDVLTYSITGVAVGHWGSYIAISDSAWQQLSDEQKEIWDQTARDIAIENAELIDAQDVEVAEEAAAAGIKFVDVAAIPEGLRSAIESASTATWRRWIEQTEEAGLPGRATAQLWAELVQAEGAELPQGVEELLVSE